MPTYSITTITALILALGGVEVVARNLHTKPAEVTSWVRRGYIPPGWHLKLHLAGQQTGHPIDASVFELNDWQWQA